MKVTLFFFKSWYLTYKSTGRHTSEDRNNNVY